MKRTLFFSPLLLCVLSLCSCQVNWFGGTAEVPWYYVVIPCALLCIAAYVHILCVTYVCPECGTEFKLKWYQFSACLHSMGKRFCKCPHCHKRSFCARKR